MVRPVDKKAVRSLGSKELGVGAASVSEQAQFYDEFWTAWHEKHRDVISPFYHFDEKSRMFMIRRALRRYVGLGQGRMAFDLGCGLGRLARELQSLNWKTGAIDLSPQTITQLSARYPAIDFHFGDMFSYQGYTYENYDLVTSSEVFEHIRPEQRLEFMRLAKSLLKPNGHLILTTPNAKVMEALGLRAEQPLDFWLTPEELKECFGSEFEIIALHTASFCVRGKNLNRFLKLAPIINSVMDRILFNTYSGKYQMLVARKVS